MKYSAQASPLTQLSQVVTIVKKLTFLAFKLSIKEIHLKKFKKMCMTETFKELLSLTTFECHNQLIP